MLQILQTNVLKKNAVPSRKQNVSILWSKMMRNSTFMQSHDIVSIVKCIKL